MRRGARLGPEQRTASGDLPKNMGHKRWNPSRLCPAQQHQPRRANKGNEMTDQVDDMPVIADQWGLSRRNVLRLAGVTAAAVPVVALTNPTGAAAAQSTADRSSSASTKIVFLGTAGGPVLTISGGRRGISTAIVYRDRVYIVDLGHGSFDQIAAAGLTGQQSALQNIRGVLFTHLHSDHITEWPALYMTATANIGGAQLPEPIRVFGPGNRQTLPRVFPPSRPAPPLIEPDDPTPGTVAMTAYLRQAFAQDFNDRLRDNNAPNPDSVFSIHEIDINPYWQVDPAGVPPVLPAGTRIPVWVDGEVTITATLVDHHPTAPAFAYRFDTPDGSVVVSGDTAPSANLIDLAQNVDYLVHEAIDEHWVDTFVAGFPPALQGPVKAHLLGAHTSLAQVGQVAEQAHARNLVLTHLIPGDIDRAHFQQVRRAFSGRLVIAEDLMELGVQSRPRQH